MLRNVLILVAIVGGGAVGLNACSPGEVSTAAVAATDSAAAKVTDAVDSAKTQAKPTIEEARAAARANDKLARDSVAAKAKAKLIAEASADMPRTTAVNNELIAMGDKTFRAGKDYLVLSPAKRTSSAPEQVELTEVFMYQCPHCFSFEPFIESVLKNQPQEMNFVRLPAIFNNVAKLHAQAFYASQAMGNWDELHTPLFKEIHTNRNLMPTEDKLLDFVESQGVDRAQFRTALKSFEVDSKVRDAQDLNAAYQIGSVPTLVVNGKYVTSGSMVGNTDKLRMVVNYLVAKEAAAL